MGDRAGCEIVCMVRTPVAHLLGMGLVDAGLLEKRGQGGGADGMVGGLLKHVRERLEHSPQLPFAQSEPPAQLDARTPTRAHAHTKNARDENAPCGTRLGQQGRACSCSAAVKTGSFRICLKRDDGFSQ